VEHASLFAPNKKFTVVKGLSDLPQMSIAAGNTFTQHEGAAAIKRFSFVTDAAAK
jgi:hypothetical protein